jgi:hypothetical protein
MPDNFFIQEQPGSWFGLYSQSSEPAALNTRFFTMFHNMVIHNGMPQSRPGRSILNSTLLGDGARTVYGIGIWRATSGDLLIVACGSLLQSLPITGGDPSPLATNYPTGFRTSPTGARTMFAQLGGRMFIVNGVDANVKFNGTSLTRMGLVAPATLAAPTKSGGTLTGTRKYVATLVSSTSNGSVESEPTAAISVSYSNQQGTFSAPAVPSSDPQVDRWNLYGTTMGGSTYYKLNSTPQSRSTSIVDNLSDASIQAGTILAASLTNSPPPGTFRLLTPHQGRLVGVTAEEPNTLYWSDIGLDLAGIYPKPESWPPRNRIVFGENGGTAITALVSFFDWLLVFQNFGTWSIKDDINSDAKIIRPLLVGPDNRGIGVSDQTNVAIAENKVIFAAKDGLYQIIREVGAVQADLAVRPLSTHISDLYQSIDFGAGGCSIYDRDKKRWVFWGKGRTNTDVTQN